MRILGSTPVLSVSMSVIEPVSFRENYVPGFISSVLRFGCMFHDNRGLTPGVRRVLPVIMAWLEAGNIKTRQTG